MERRVIWLCGPSAVEVVRGLITIIYKAFSKCHLVIESKTVVCLGNALQMRDYYNYRSMGAVVTVTHE